MNGRGATNGREFKFTASRYYQAGDTGVLRSWREFAKRVEDLGYAKLNVGEHYIHVGGHPAQWLAPVPALMTVLNSTTTLRAFTSYTPVAFHHPAVFAQQWATMDVLSEGRVDVGLGTGSIPGDFEAAHVPFHSPGARIRQLSEFIEVLRGLWAPGHFSFHGEFYEIDDIDGAPKPLQQPFPPIVIGAHGRKLLSMAAREAQGINIAPGAPGFLKLPLDPVDIYFTRSAEIFREKIDWIREAEQGRVDKADLGVSTGFAAITDDRDGYLSSLASRLGASVDEMVDNPNVVVGTVHHIVEQLVERRERFGLSVYQFPDPIAMAPVVARLAGT